MKRTTIELPDALMVALEVRARNERRSESEIIREALTEKLSDTGKNASDMQFGLFASKHTNTSENVDDILSGSLAPFDA